MSFTYDDRSPWPTLPDGRGYTLSAWESNPTGDPNNPFYWVASTTLNGSPFADDSNAHVSLADQPAIATLVQLYPNPTDGVFFVKTTTQEPYTIQVYDVQGRLLMQEAGTQESMVDLGKQALPNGLYLVKIQWASHSAMHKVVYTR